MKKENNKDKSFKEKLEQDIIPGLSEMIKKEKEHLVWLKESEAPGNFISESEKHLKFYEKRHKEYIEYSKTLQPDKQ